MDLEGKRMRRSIVALVLLGLLFAACAENDDSDSNTSAGGGTSPGAEGCDLAAPPIMDEGVLTVATDRPAFPPWFEGSPKDYSGFEGEVASEIAERMGLQITWIVEPFNKSYAPGAKDYDFDINQITVTPEREEAVDFSDPYFIDNQGLLALKDNPITEVASIEDLKRFQLGAQVGTTSLAFINETIQPDADPKIFDTTNDVKSALESGQVDALITDVVTTVYLRDFEIDGSEVVGQFETGEPFGMLFEKGSPLVDCVNQVLAEMESDGTLESLQDEWLQDYLGVPTIE
jgi:polar amino acid transport system substrate-binding protein